jgi:PadR family transcriptional regulator, regulatory protein PadR
MCLWPTKSNDLVQGTLDGLILKTLALESMHGYGVDLCIEPLSRGVFRVKSGFPVRCLPAVAKSRMDQKADGELPRITSEQNSTLTEQGRKKLSSEIREREKQVAAIARILEAS